MIIIMINGRKISIHRFVARTLFRIYIAQREEPED